ncbi:bifunctional folylpolyglutamate synthase/dihydrofolate synthase [Leptothoe sp. PORK10 BA2]|uniref:bifunctional folylpolyglutamate synthase/dihydrofolate synthase n=1 Tax=Leptothoe sp. PORK10 BA2 TaxID=3110254 RepID=UPI002B208304|nr:folylpolyglutamate synthase/dihydrofolate synthase family protein [Leptothoe sp. PORK10 BA2]MEA5463942.1 folylpolyglutamate synthase/dihydrofolate synthase family protein [Leptothoe sp. PORK10 BA2]
MLFEPSVIDDFLSGYGRFGVNLGLERIQRLLARLGNPQEQVPIVHVAGTNGKGSVCAYLASVLSVAGYRVGRYTSPHLLNWNERICINQTPITDADLWQHLKAVAAATETEQTSPHADGDPTPTQFEVFTAAAWSYFAAQAVDIAIVEVGLGGRLDATNVCPVPLVTAIVSLSREHWQSLGPTLTDIAREKAGILKPGRPVVIGPLPEDADGVVRQRAAQLGCGLYDVTPAATTESGQWRSGLDDDLIDYGSGLLGDHQRVNSGVAIAILQLLQRQGWTIPTAAIQQGMATTQWPGRLQWLTWQGQQILIDGAHNTAAAQMLRCYVDSLPQPVTWLMGMLATKDHKDIFTALLRPGDTLHLVPVPGHQSADTSELTQLAQMVCADLNACYRHETLEQALMAMGDAKNDAPHATKVLCGSLYLVGEFLAQGNVSCTTEH